MRKNPRVPPGPFISRVEGWVLDEQEEVLTPRLWKVPRAWAPLLKGTLSSGHHLSNKHQE